MKLKKIALVLTALVLIVALAACNTTPQTSQPTLTSVSATYTGEAIEVGGTLDKSDIVVTATYSDNSSKKVDNFTVSALDTSTAGVKKVTITYKEGDITKTYQLSITVVDSSTGTPVTYVELTAQYTGEAVLVGQQPDKADFVVTAHYSNDTTKKVTNFSLSTVDTSTAGEKAVTVSYTEGDITLTTDVKISVVANSSQRIEVVSQVEQVAVGSTLDTSLITVTYITQDNPEGVELTAAEYQLEYNFDTAGVATVTVSYTPQDSSEALTYTFSVEVVESTVRLYFYNYANWGNVYAHYWKEGDTELSVSTEWPGVVMTKDADSKWYYLDVDRSCQSIIFNNNVKDYTLQTDNLTIDVSKPYYAILGWSDVKSVDNILVLDLSVSSWVENNARFAVNMFNTTTSEPAVWLDLVGVVGQNKQEVLNYRYYAVDISGVDADTFILCRMNSATTVNDWTNKWNQTIDLSLAGGLYVKLASGWESGEKATPEVQSIV